MKWFVWLFSIYLLFLSCVPCTAEDDCCSDEVSTTLPYEKGPDEQHKPSCPCSPFFACSTCHGVIPSTIDVQLSKILLPVSKLPFFYTEQDLLDFPPAIWQPPKMS